MTQIDGALEAWPDAEVHVFPDVGHWPYLEEPEKFNATLLDFLDRHPAG